MRHDAHAARHRCRVAHCAYPELLGRSMCLVYVWNLLVQHSVASQEPQDVTRIYFPADLVQKPNVMRIGANAERPEVHASGLHSKCTDLTVNALT